MKRTTLTPILLLISIVSFARETPQATSAAVVEKCLGKTFSNIASAADVANAPTLENAEVPALSISNDANDSFGNVFLRPTAFRKAVVSVEAIPSSEDPLIDVYLALESSSKAGIDIQVRFQSESTNEAFQGVVMNVRGGETENIRDFFNHAYVKLTPDASTEETRSIMIKDILPGSLSIKERKYPTPDFVKDLKLISDVASKSGIQSLSHRTRNFDSLYKILQDGELKPASSGAGKWSGGRDAVYMTLMTENMDLSARPEPFLDAHFAPTLEFDGGVLNREDYYVNPNWDYGAYYSGSMPAGSALLRRFIYLYGVKRQLLPGINPEVVIQGHVGLNHLKRIWVSKGSKSGLLKELERLNIRPPAARIWSDLIFETNYVRKF